MQPEEHRTQEALEALVVSAQFRSQLDVFGAALQSGQLDLAQFGLQAEVHLHDLLVSTAVTVVTKTCCHACFLCLFSGAAAEFPCACCKNFFWYTQGYSVAAFLESIQQQVDKEQREGGADA